MALNSLKVLFSKIAFDAMNNKSDFLKKSGIAGILTTAVCQTAAVVINKDVPQKEKKFMVAQEVADGAINLTVFWILTAYCVKCGRDLAGKWVDNKAYENIFKNTLKKIQTTGSEKSQKVFEKKELSDITQGYLDGLGTIIGMIGSVVANNFISPPLRNYAASLYQKDQLAKNPAINKTETCAPVDQSTAFKQRPFTPKSNMSVFLNRTKYQTTNPLKPF